MKLSSKSKNPDQSNSIVHLILLKQSLLATYTISWNSYMCLLYMLDRLCRLPHATWLIYPNLVSNKYESALSVAACLLLAPSLWIVNCTKLLLASGRSYNPSLSFNSEIFCQCNPDSYAWGKLEKGSYKSVRNAKGN